MTMKKRYRYYRLDADTVNQLKDMDKRLSGPLPADLDAFEQDGYGLSGDFYEYFALVAGSLGFVLADKKMPKVQHQSLEKSFFELYPKDKIENYPETFHQVAMHENVRRLLCSIINRRKT
ncbi:Immunity protein WapI [Bacillus licheniformis]|nr:Immunity protein WapI [Bacillus licheniformis]